MDPIDLAGLTGQAGQKQAPLQQPTLFIRFLAWLLNTALDIAQWTTIHGERILHEYHVLEWLESFLMYSTRQPVAAVVLGLATILCGLPIFLFACFAVITSVITFTCFCFVEGTLLTMGFAVLLTFLIVFGFFGVGLLAIASAVYLGAQKFRMLLDYWLWYLIPTKPLEISKPPVPDCKAD